MAVVFAVLNPKGGTGKNPAAAFEGIAAGVGALVIDLPGESVAGFASRFAQPPI